MTDSRYPQQIKLSLKVKAMVFICLLILVVSGSLSWYFLRQSQRRLVHEMEKRALPLAKSLAHNSRYGILTKDQVILQELVQGVLHEDSVIQVRIINAQGNTLAQGNNARQGDKIQPATELSVPDSEFLATRVEAPALYTQALDKRRLYRAVAPVLSTSTALSPRQQNLNAAILLLGSEEPATPPSKTLPIRLGSVHIALSPAAMQADIRNAFITGIGITLAIALAGAGAAFIFYSYTLTPVKAMAKAASDIAAGDLSQRVDATSHDEIGVLAHTFNQMTEALDQRLTELTALALANALAYQQIERLNVGLEAQVRARTAELRLRQETLQKQSVELQRQQVELQRINHELEVVSRHKSEFLANMSHELRTPLNAVISFSHVLLEKVFGDLNVKQEEYIGDILRSGEYLLSLLSDVLDLSKIEAGKVDFKPRLLDLKPLLENSLVMVKEHARTRRIRLSLAIDGVNQLYADERQVKQIMFNLLSNAVKFTPDGGRVGVDVLQSHAGVQIAVWDTGVGIAQADQRRIFEAFQQVDTDFTAAIKGTGLGLTLSKKFVDLHGGTIRVASTPGQGSTFAFTLPEPNGDVVATTPGNAPDEREAIG